MLNRLVENESYEPMFSWGLRMTFAVIIPLFYGIYFHKMAEVMWVIVAAESIGWVELKGSFAQRVRLLLGGAFLALLFGFAGSISNGNLLLSIFLMLGVVFIASLFKNLGERGSGLSLTIYVMFIIANAYPVASFVDISYRCVNIGIGGLWSLAVGAIASLFIAEQTPYKRSVAFIWKATEGLAAAIALGWDGKEARSGVREVYLKEKDVNEAVNSSLQLYDKRAYQTNHDNEHARQMAHLRKSAYLTSATLMAIYEELEAMSIHALTGEQRQSIYVLLKSIEIICARMTIFTVSNKAEEEMLINSRVLRIQNMCALLKESKLPESEYDAVQKIIHFAERINKLVDNSIAHINSVSTDQKVYRSYSLMKTLLILHHRHWIDTVRRLANINTHSFRYALRSAIIATIALIIYKWFQIPYGYWLPFSVMIIIQPYFGATIKKALDRVAGTLLGVVIGGFLMTLPREFHAKEILLIISPILMVYFLRSRYSVATFFISMFLVALFAAEHSLDNSVILMRALSTIGGASLAIVGEFVLFPTWDKNWLPKHIASAMQANFDYFLFTFYPNNFGSAHQWTHFRRMAESANSNAFDSFNRYLAEPSSVTKDYALHYQIISHCIRITRELNNYHIESDLEKSQQTKQTFEPFKLKIHECLLQFNYLMAQVYSIKSLKEKEVEESLPIDESISFIPINDLQSIYLQKLTVELNAFVRDMDKWISKVKVSHE